MDTNNLLMTGFVLTVGAMAILISIISFGFMIMYQVRNKVKVNNYVKMIMIDHMYWYLYLKRYIKQEGEFGCVSLWVDKIKSLEIYKI